MGEDNAQDEAEPLFESGKLIQFQISHNARWVTGYKTSSGNYRPLFIRMEIRDDKGDVQGLGPVVHEVSASEVCDERDLEPYAAWQMEIDAEDRLSLIFFMASTFKGALAFVIFNLIVWAFVGVFVYWLIFSRESELFKGDNPVEVIAIVIVIVGVVCPSIPSDIKDMPMLTRLWGVAQLLQPSVGGPLRTSVVIMAVDIFQTLVLKALSVYVGLFLSENDLLDAILNIVALEFVAEIDTALMKYYITSNFPDTKVNFCLLDCNYYFFKCNYPERNAFWDNSSTSLEIVQELLNSPGLSNSDKLNLVTSGSIGLGLLGKWPKSHHVVGCRGTPQVGSAVARISLLDWSAVSYQSISTYEGPVLLRGTSKSDWELVLSQQQRLRFICCHPEACIGYTLSGNIWLNSSNINVLHVKVLLQIARNSPNLRGLILKNNPEVDDECAEYIAHFLRTNTTVVFFSVDNTGITDEGAELILAALKENPLACSFCFQIGGPQQQISGGMLQRMQDEVGDFHGDWFAQPSFQLPRGVC